MINNYKKNLKAKGEVYLRIKVHPGAKKSGIKGILRDEENGETFKIDIAAIAEKGKANLELIKFLTKEFAVKKENVKIISGHTDKIKLIKIINS